MTESSEEVVAVPPPKKSLSQRWKSMSAREARLAWFLILPTAVIVFGLVIFPAIFSIWIAFHDVGLGDLNDVFNTEFVGFDNFRAVINDFAFKPGPLPADWEEANILQKIGLDHKKIHAMG